jgi:Spy/CpxP family protein refolding chaperone
LKLFASYRYNLKNQKMRNVFLALLLFVGITTLAQEKRGAKLTSEEKVDLQVKRMTRDLSLNEKQVKEVRAIVAKEVEKRDAKRTEVKEQKSKKREEMKSKMQEEQAALAADMKKILTAEQYTKWEKQREEKKSKLKERMGERRGKGEFKPIEEDK